MFFFLFDENLSDNILVQEAFYNQCFKKIIETGYCDMTIFFGKSKLRRETIVYELETRNSPLVVLFKKSYPRSIEEATTKLVEVLERFVWKEKVIDSYSEFAIVYYIYKSLSTNEMKENFTRNILESWQMQDRERLNNESYDMDLRLSNGIIFDNNITDKNVHLLSF